jgi:hypothetical protein
MIRPKILTDATHAQLEHALDALLVAYDGGTVLKPAFINNVMHLITVVDTGNLTEVNTFIALPLGKAKK